MIIAFHGLEERFSLGLAQGRNPSFLLSSLSTSLTQTHTDTHTPVNYIEQVTLYGHHGQGTAWAAAKPGTFCM